MQGSLDRSIKRLKDKFDPITVFKGGFVQSTKAYLAYRKCKMQITWAEFEFITCFTALHFFLLAFLDCKYIWGVFDKNYSGLKAIKLTLYLTNCRLRTNNIFLGVSSTSQGSQRGPNSALRNSFFMSHLISLRLVMTCKFTSPYEP